MICTGQFLVWLLAVNLVDSAAGIELQLPQAWEASSETMRPGLVLSCGKLRAEIDYYNVLGKGYTRLDIMRLNQEDVREFLRASEYHKKGETQEINLPGGFAVRARAARKRSGKKAVAFLITGAWDMGERGVVSWMFRLKLVKQGSLKFTREEEQQAGQLLSGLRFF